MWTMLRDGWEKDKRRKGGERKAGTDGWKEGCVGYLKVCIVLDGRFFNSSSFFFNVVKKLENNFHKPKIQEWTYSRVTQFEAQDGVIIICSVYVVVLWILFSHVLATLKRLRVLFGTNQFLHDKDKSTDLDIPTESQDTINYSATLGHKVILQGYCSSYLRTQGTARLL